MHTISNAKAAPHLIPQFREWVETEWGKVDPFESAVEGVVLPAPLLALVDQKLVGGIGFTTYTRPGSTANGVWINILYVAPEFRNRGIAQDLIKAAESEARTLAIDELFVFTAIPKLYERLGWTVVPSVEGSTVLHRVLPP